MATDYGDPVYVDELPPVTNKGGRTSNAPALEAWLGKIAPGKTAELPSTDEDKAHPVSRVTQLRNIGKAKGFTVDTRAITPGKRYRIFATHVAPTAADANGKAPAKATPAKA